MSNRLAEQLLVEFREETAITRRYLERVPEASYGWRPHERSLTLAQLAGHVAEAPGWCAGMAEDSFDLASLEGTYTPFVPASAAELVAGLEKNVKLFEEFLEGRDDAFMLATYTMRMGEKVLQQDPRHAAVRRLGINHWVHHRGQLSVYLRLLDVPVPGSYGPSADDETWG